MTLYGLVFLLSWFGPSVAAFYFMRRGGRSVWGALTGAVWLWAVNFGLIFALWVALAKFHLPEDWIAFFAPIAVVEALIFWLRRYGPPTAPGSPVVSPGPPRLPHSP